MLAAANEPFEPNVVFLKTQVSSDGEPFTVKYGILKHCPFLIRECELVGCNGVTFVVLKPLLLVVLIGQQLLTVSYGVLKCFEFSQSDMFESKFVDTDEMLFSFVIGSVENVFSLEPVCRLLRAL